MESSHEWLAALLADKGRHGGGHTARQTETSGSARDTHEGLEVKEFMRGTSSEEAGMHFKDKGPTPLQTTFRVRVRAVAMLASNLALAERIRRTYNF